jgi:hypothetical protein
MLRDDVPSGKSLPIHIVTESPVYIAAVLVPSDHTPTPPPPAPGAGEAEANGSAVAGAASPADGADAAGDSPPQPPDDGGDEPPVSAPPSLTDWLHAHHLERLHNEYGLNDDTIRAAQIKTLADAKKIAGRLNWTGPKAEELAATLGPCIGIPFYTWDWDRKSGPIMVRFRPDNPRKDQKKGSKPTKYEQPAKSSLHAYIPPMLIGTGFREGFDHVLITEGEFKALKATQEGFHCIAVTGIHCGLKSKKGKREAPDELVPGIAEMNKCRPWTIVWDSDQDGKLDAKRAAFRLQAVLRAGFGEVSFLVLPPKKDGSKQGLDDLLSNPDFGPDALRKLLSQARPCPNPNLDELSNCVERDVTDENGNTKTVEEPRAARDILSDITEKADGYPVAVGKTLYAIRNGKLLGLGNERELFAFLSDVFDRSGESKVRWVNHPGARTKAEFYAFACQAAKQYEGVSKYPHFPPIDTILYQPYEVTGGDGTALVKLLDFFSPATEFDAILLAAAFATPAWGGPPGKRPLFLLEAEEGAPNGGRGTGKTTVAKLVAHLYGGAYSLNANEDWSDFKKKLLNDQSEAGRRCVLYDNIKQNKVSWADLEAFITDARINGHQLYKGSRDILNLFTTFLTMNGVNLATDLALRAVPIRLKRPVYRDDWEPAVTKFIDENRAAILGDIKALLVDVPPVVPSHCTRFPEWDTAVLSKFAGEDTDAVIQSIREWQQGVDGDEEQADLIRDALARVLTQIKDKIGNAAPEEAHVRLTPRAVCELMHIALNDRFTIPVASSRLKSAAVPELTQHRRHDWDGGRRRWQWRGGRSECQSPTHLVDFDPAPGAGWGAEEFGPGVAAITARSNAGLVTEETAR